MYVVAVAASVVLVHSNWLLLMLIKTGAELVDLRLYHCHYVAQSEGFCLGKEKRG